MKTKQSFKFIILFALFNLITFSSCSKDVTTDTPINQIGGEIFRSQVVTINLDNITLSENEYQATFGAQNITVSKSDEHKLFFLVPHSTEIGMQDLVISSLNDATIHYDVQDTVLSETIEVTMESFFANLETFHKI